MITVTGMQNDGEQAAMASGEAGGACKSIADQRGATPGPGTAPEPGTIAPEDFGRGYLDAGHAANSPMAGPPNTPPMPPIPRGVVTPVQLPGVTEHAGHGGPIMQALAAHQARAGIPVRPSADGL
jgi:hypothetical protein